MTLTLHDKARLYHELARFVKSGFGFQRAAMLLDDAYSNRASRRFAQALRDGVQSGQTLAQSLSAPGLGVSRLELTLIEAAEAAGALEEAFGYLGDYFESILKTRREIRARLIYPLVLIHAAALIPALPELVQGKPPLEAFFPSVLALTILYAILIFVGMAGPWLARLAAQSAAVDGLLGMIPLLGSTRRALALQRFSQVFRMHLLCGRKISSALEAAGEAAQSGRILRATRVLVNTVRSGQPAGSVIRAQREFPREFAQSIASSEVTGTLPDELGRWAAYYGENARDRLDRLGVWLPRFIYVAAAAYMVWRILAMANGIYQPLLDQMNQEP